MNLAPIVLFTFKRPKHTLKVLKALKKNDLADQSVLHIFCDGPTKNISKKELESIEEVRKVVKQEKWCKTVNIVEFKENKGLANSVIYGMNLILKTYDRVIVLEDDIVPSKGFLNFMNHSLELYKDIEQVYGVSGYKYPCTQPLPSTYLLPIGCSWSWGTWKRAWDEFEPDTGKLLGLIEEDQVKDFNFGNYPFYKMLKFQYEGKIDSWAIRYYASFFLKKGLFLYPNCSLVRNIGFDNSGTHNGKDKFFSNVNYCSRIDLKNEIVKLDTKYTSYIAESFSNIYATVSFIDKMKAKILNIINIK